ncbi:hypothetical protein SCHPADRAFT_662150 [Schizopora paradoxa]|uniref:Uncharacterized protein n=1 Tax=Schizopora paradoxa TaxID=27342 RepID=A0A0H2RQQ7_9AGAM|nr:hypothetical protein SCHPADRAFT_662150 [Schizopora paradoxa]
MPVKCLSVSRFSNLPEIMDTSELQSLEGSRILEKVVSGPRGLCSKCRTSLVNAINDERREIWAAIPSFFGFSGWNTLEIVLDKLIS